MQGGRRAGGGDERVFAAAVDLLASGARSFKRTARRFSLCAEDAEDAYQRGLEILLTKAPNDDAAELRPWLHTVIKHEALALRRQRERLLGGPATEIALATTPGPEEGSAERERGRQTAEALGQLKPSEIQCLLLKALGYSYDEISGRTGYSWTKVNRSLTEGRRRFFRSFDQIESGRRCRSLEPLLSSVCDGEAPAKRERELRAHLRGCSACRATLRAYRAAPARLAELIPPAIALPSLVRSSWWSRLHDMLVAGTGERIGAAGYKLQQAADLASAQKAAAVVASTAAIAGGAVAGERAVDSHHPRRAQADRQAHHRRDQNETAARKPVTVAAAPVARVQAPQRKPAGRQRERTKNRGQEFGIEGAPISLEAAASSTGERVSVSNQAPKTPARVASRSTGGEFGP